MHLAKDYIKSLKEILSSAVRYRYEIYFVFCDGRDEIKKKIPLKLFRSENRPLSKQELELYKTVEKEILKKLKKTVPAQRMDSNDVTALNNYTAVPADEVIADYYVEEILLRSNILINRQDHQCGKLCTVVRTQYRVFRRSKLIMATELMM